MRHVGFALTLMASVFGLGATHARGAVGDPVATISPQPTIGSQFCSIGLAFGGTQLYFNRCSDSNIYTISPVDGALISTFDTGIAEWPAAMSYDTNRNGLWIGTQRSIGGSGFGVCGDPAVVNADMPIYFWDFDDDTVTLMFTVPFDITNPANGQRFFTFCRLDGLLYDPITDEIWCSDTVNENIGVFRTDGTFVEGFDATAVGAGLPNNFDLANNTGLIFGGDKLYLTDDGGSHIIRTGKTPDTVSGELLPGTIFANGNGWLGDMACDSNTFAPTDVVWVRTDPRGSVSNDLITAYEIEAGGCGPGLPIGACCDPNLAPCRDVLQSQCQGATEVWTGGVLCADLDPPCHAMHRIILLDRTGSMQTPFDDSTTRCERARQTAISDVMSFFVQNPVGSSVAVWIFTGTEPTPLTVGFVDEATAKVALESLEGVNCSGSTPLAESLCGAVDALLAAFPVAADKSLEISVSTDGEENNSDGSCAGDRVLLPQFGGSPFGEACGEFHPDSWQQKVCDHTIGNAVVLARLWGDLSQGRVTGKVDAETGTLLGTGVPDATFFQALADATGGTFTFIDDFPAPPSGPPAFGVTGACCLSDGTCQESITEAECAVLGGTHQGDASICAEATGACCLPSDTCQDAITLTACTEQGGSFQGTCTTCANDVMGACCLLDSTCQDGLTPTQCAALIGTHQGGCSICTSAQGECEIPIPAVSEWGLFMMALLVVTAGSIVLRSRSATHSVQEGMIQ